MSNHSGSYMLNDVMKMLDRYSVFQWLGDEKAQEFGLELIRLADGYDCNADEILEGFGGRLGICFCCEKTASSFQEDVCQSCYDKYYS